MNNASLVVVGSGIKFLSHLTTEARAYIQQSEKVLYLVNDPAMKEWIRENNSQSESLDHLYTQFPLREDCYRAITDCILNTLRKKQHVCVVFYGHPCVFAEPGLDAVIQAKKEGYYAKILPGISAENCFFADLLIDPGSCGCHSFEATDFLLYKRQFDPACHLLLWQVDIIGVLTNPEFHDNRDGAKVLVDYLKRSYHPNHEVIIYEAAQYPSFEPKIQKIPLCKLPETKMTRTSMLYVPPSHQTSYDKSMAEKLNINLINLRNNTI